MRTYEAAQLPPEGRFHYHQGVFLSGVYKTYELCKEGKYAQYVKDWVDSVITLQGEIKSADMGQFDDMQPGILLYPLYQRTGDKKYKKVEWADPETGCSPEFWGRAMGWVPVALLDELDFIPLEHAGRKELEEMAVNLLKSLVAFQSEEGRWYQVVDKGVDLLVGDVCIGTGVGNYEHYIHRPVSTNDLHGVGAFLLMCEEMEQVIGESFPDGTPIDRWFFDTRIPTLQ